MDSLSLSTVLNRFVYTVFAGAGDLLEPDCWVLPQLDAADNRHIVFLCKPPMAHNAREAYKQILSLNLDVPIHFHLYYHGKFLHEEREQLISATRLYGGESLTVRECSRQKPQQTDQDRIISDWLSLAGEKEKITVLQQSDTSITVRCGDSMQAGELWYNLPRLKATGLKFATIYIGKSFFNSLSLDRIAKDDLQTFIQSLLSTHQEIIEAGSMVIDKTIKIYCSSKEEAIALYDGCWDLAERAQEQQLPQLFELYYPGDDQKPHLYRDFSVRAGLLVKILQRREIAALCQDLDVENL
ncbi:hypothetical protein H6F86_00375 [Phormidium sp. FACHB-592]|uniref:Uncharacterized protein n=1 Tax=Stenomitos frigidus AS-A4 TaxID=2933935 RepID=A0ABV0KSW0_9CYAN|nr:hypothetical protein [Phormidium sp. FACHB-592]MBD2072389.1 hypothetical protein [Phormidium sp. FACHB-592]